MTLKKVTAFVAGFIILVLGCIIFGKKTTELRVISLVVPPSVTASSNLSTTQNSATFIAVGDIMLGRHVEDLMNQHGDNYPFAPIENYLNSANIVVANLEGPILENHIPTPDGSFHFAFDTRMPGVLYDHNVKIVNLANNHTYDYGVDGFSQTVSYLDQAHVFHAGNPFQIGDEYVLHTQINGKKFLFVGFNITNPNFNFDQAYLFVKNIQREPDEFFIAMVHGGTEYATTSDATQQMFDRGLIDNGVDLVLGHHPHVVEEIENYKNKLIFYSLGNFIFDQYFSQDVQQELTVKINFTATSTSYELVPVISSMSQPQLMGQNQKQQFLNDLAQKSSTDLTHQIESGIILK